MRKQHIDVLCVHLHLKSSRGTHGIPDTAPTLRCDETLATVLHSHVCAAPGSPEMVQLEAKLCPPHWLPGPSVSRLQCENTTNVEVRSRGGGATRVK